MAEVTNTAPGVVPVNQDPKQVRNAQRNAQRKAAKSFLRNNLNTPLPADAKYAAELYEQIMQAVAVCIGTGMGGGGRNTGNGGILGKLREIFSKKPIVDELELFKLTRMGRAEMRKRCRALIRDVAPEERMWISFDEKTESWVLKGTGEKAPTGWEGFKPVETAPAK